MWRVYALLALVWLALMPPLFTAGACTAEYDRVSAQVMRSVAAGPTPDAAAALWRAQGYPVSVLSLEQCRQAKPRVLDRCGSGTWVYAKVPVQHAVCRLYRDDSIGVQLQYDDKARLQWVKSKMAPYKTLPLPFGWPAVHWAR